MVWSSAIRTRITMPPASVHEGGGISGGFQGRDRETELGAVALRCGNHRARRHDVGTTSSAAGRALVAAPLRGLAVIREHVDLGSDAKNDRALERAAEGVCVRVDESGQQRPAGAVHKRGPLGYRDVSPAAGSASSTRIGFG
ncbi:MAG: hypothetical protein H0X67_16110 [Acidobacteria bacterium]|nr:hypothetical protein [Acidobacteriota bacterium]